MDGGDPHELQPQRRRGHGLRGQDLRVGRARRAADLQQRKSLPKGLVPKSVCCRQLGGEASGREGSVPSPHETKNASSIYTGRFWPFQSPFSSSGRKEIARNPQKMELKCLLFPTKGDKSIECILLTPCFLYFFLTTFILASLELWRPRCQALPLLPPTVWWLHFQKDFLRNELCSRGSCWCKALHVPQSRISWGTGKAPSVSGLDLALMRCSQEANCNSGVCREQQFALPPRSGVGFCLQQAPQRQK